MADERPAVLTDLDPVHMIGIGGAGMSALAKVLLARGIRVSGSDMKRSVGLTALEALGARIRIGHGADVVGGAAAVVVSSAIRGNNPELIAAREADLPILHRAQVLALLLRERRGIAVAGTHGKTTTTSMIALLLQQAGLDPTFLIGGHLNEQGTNAHHGAGQWLVAEADESDGSFLWLAPEIAVVTNIEAEHLDHYADEAEVRETFLAFMGNLPDDGMVVACADDPGVRAVLPRVGLRVVTYGLERGDWTAGRTDVDATGQTIEVARGGEALGAARVSAPGAHNARNALAALVVADAVGIPFATASHALALFQGVERRFQPRGGVDGITIVDDYAHHPTEVTAALATAREQPHRRVVAVFQPHLYSRTKHLGAALGAALAAADLVVVTDVYGAREEPQPGVTGKLVVDGVLETAPRRRVAYLPKRGDVPAYLASRLREGDLVLTIGAGDVTMLGDDIIRAVKERRS